MTDIEKEDESDMLRSILSQFEYTYLVCDWDRKGVPFRTYFYVPEIHPITGVEFHEREDDAHVLKVQYYIYMYIYTLYLSHTSMPTHSYTHTHTLYFELPWYIVHVICCTICG